MSGVEGGGEEENDNNIESQFLTCIIGFSMSCRMSSGLFINCVHLYACVWWYEHGCVGGMNKEGEIVGHVH